MCVLTSKVVPHVLLVWLCDSRLKEVAKRDKYVASARLNMATGKIFFDVLAFIVYIKLSSGGRSFVLSSSANPMSRLLKHRKGFEKQLSWF